MKKLLLLIMMLSFVGVNTANAQSWSMGAGTENCGKFLTTIRDFEEIESF